MTTIPEKLKYFSFVKLDGRTKKPFDKDWQVNPVKLKEIKKWISLGNNYGILCGYKGRVVIDSDAKELTCYLEKALPKTFTVKGRPNRRHFYFDCPDLDETITLAINPAAGKAYGSVFSKGHQVVGPGSIHPITRKLYTIVNDVPIVNITKAELMKIVDPFLAKYENKNQVDIPNIAELVEEKFGKKVVVKEYLRYYLTNCYSGKHEDKHPSMLISRTTGYISCKACGYKSNIKKDFGIRLEEDVDPDEALQQGHVDILKAVNEVPPTPDFVIPGLKLGNVGALVSTGGLGKSFFDLQTGISIATGIPLCGGIWGTDKQPLKTGKIVIFSAEDSSEDIAARIHSIIKVYAKAGIKVPDLPLLEQNLHIFSLVSYIPELMNVEGNHQASRWYDSIVKYSDGARLVMLDPISRFRGISEENSNTLATRLIQILESITYKVKTALLVTHHSSKAAALNGVGSQRDAIRGASAFSDAIRLQYNLTTMTENEAEELLRPSKWDPEDEPRLKFLKLTMSKVNYTEQQRPIWLHRESDGVLMQAKQFQGNQQADTRSKPDKNRKMVG